MLSYSLDPPLCEGYDGIYHAHRNPLRLPIPSRMDLFKPPTSSLLYMSPDKMLYSALDSSSRNDLTYLTFLDLVTTTNNYYTTQTVNSRFAEFLSPCVNSVLSFQ